MVFEQGINLEKCCDALRGGGVVAYPTDTVYGLGADIHNETAVQKIYRIKSRERDKPLLVNVSDISQLYNYLDTLSQLEQTLASEFWPGALTLILKVNSNVPVYISKGSLTMGVRVPAHELALKLLRKYGKPLISTSVNYSGDPALLDDRSIREQFSQYLYYLLGENEHCPGVPSTIVQVDNGRIKLLRSGSCDKDLYQKYADIIDK